MVEGASAGRDCKGWLGNVLSPFTLIELRNIKRFTPDCAACLARIMVASVFIRCKSALPFAAILLVLGTCAAICIKTLIFFSFCLRSIDDMLAKSSG